MLLVMMWGEAIIQATRKHSVICMWDLNHSAFDAACHSDLAMASSCDTEIALCMVDVLCMCH